MEYSQEKIQRLLDGGRKSNEEDLLILHPDGSRSCIGWELTNGFQLTDIWKTEEELSDSELLMSAYKELIRRRNLLNGK